MSTVVDEAAFIPHAADPPISTLPGCVALPTSEIGRFMLFTISLTGTIQPHGSRLHAAASANVIENTNSIIRDLLDDDAWVWLIGDDHVWPTDTLMVMLGVMDKRPDIDILVPLVVRRNPPWHLVLYHELVGKKDDDGTQLLRPYSWPEIPPMGTTFEVDAAGSAGMLIRRHVLDAIGDPWLNSTTDKEGRQVVMNEDITFCLKARHEHGFKVWATTEAMMGHLGIFNVRPMFKDGRWGAMTEFSSADDQFRHLFMPQETGNA